MRKKTGLQRQISEIFGDENAPIKRLPSLSRIPKSDLATPRSPRPEVETKEGDKFISTETVRPPDSRFLEMPPEPRIDKSISQSVPSSSSSVQLIKQRYRSSRIGMPATRIKKLVQITVALLLTAVLIWQVVNMIRPSSTGDAMVESKPQAQTHSVTGELPGADWPIPQVYPQDTRDPMEWNKKETATSNTEPEISAPDLSRPVVHGILYSEDKPRAIIGSKIVGEGDLIEGATIVKINRKTVEFDMNGQKWIQGVETSDSK